MSFTYIMQEESSTKSAQSLEIKALVLKAARKLFNDLGTEAVTFQDIADQAGISAGNLYYYFKNKKSIVRALFYEIEVFSVKELWQISPANREVRFADFMQFYFGSFAKYRFFFREFSVLLQQDPILANEWRRSYDRLLSVMLDALNGWVKQGLVKPFNTQKDAETFIGLIWIVATFTPVHVFARKGKVGPEYSKEVNHFVSKFLYPYHTEKGQKVLDLYL